MTYSRIFYFVVRWLSCLTCLDTLLFTPRSKLYTYTDIKSLCTWTVYICWPKKAEVTFCHWNISCSQQFSLFLIPIWFGWIDNWAWSHCGNPCRYASVLQEAVWTQKMMLFLYEAPSHRCCYTKAWQRKQSKQSWGGASFLTKHPWWEEKALIHSCSPQEQQYLFYYFAKFQGEHWL